MILEKETNERYGYCANSLAKTSNKFCACKCDYCGAAFDREMRRITKGRKSICVDICDLKECKIKKYKEVYEKKTSKRKDEIQKKRDNTNIERFGVNNPAKLKDKIEKQQKTMLERYGVTHALKSAEFGQKRSDTMMERHGTLSSIEASGTKELIIEKLKRKTSETQEKGKQTSIERYACEYPMQNETVKRKSYDSLIQKYGPSFWADISDSGDRKLDFLAIQECCKKKKYAPLFLDSEYVNNRQILKFKCLLHDLEFESCVFYVQTSFNQCPKCRNYSTSRQETEIKDYVASICNLTIVANTRSAIPPLELDVFISEKNLAIEHHGLYWHSALLKDKDYHRNKFLACKGKGVLLLQFYEDEWRDKKEICQSIIKNKLGLTSRRYFARKLFLIESDDQNKQKFVDFFNKNHLQGNARFIKAFGLTDADKNIVFAISLRRPFTKKEKCIEIARVCSIVDAVIVGGFSKLLKRCVQWSKEGAFKEMITYSDCRYSHGGTYASCGFSFVQHTVTSYAYTDFLRRFNRFKFRANSDKSENQVAQEGGVVKLYGSGNFRWRIEL